jgi:HEPN domain-containing protein
MGFFADPWLREARDSIKSLPDQRSNISNLQGEELDKLAAAVEKAIKAALIENCGTIPQQHNHSNLVSLCQSTGVWEILPPALQNLVQEVESYRSLPMANADQPPSQASYEQLQRYFFSARRLIDYMEFHVIGNNSVLKRLTVV